MRLLPSAADFVEGNTDFHGLSGRSCVPGGERPSSSPYRRGPRVGRRHSAQRKGSDGCTRPTPPRQRYGESVGLDWMSEDTKGQERWLSGDLQPNRLYPVKWRDTDAHLARHARGQRAEPPALRHRPQWSRRPCFYDSQAVNAYYSPERDLVFPRRDPSSPHALVVTRRRTTR